MYHDLVRAKGQMHALGINLADSVRTHQSSFVHVIPYALLVLVAVGLQYVSIWQVTTRNPAATQANPQMQSMQKFMPLIFLVLYIALPAGVGVYFIVSSLFRVAQQEWMYKHDPTIVAAIKELTQRKAGLPSGSGTDAPEPRSTGGGSRGAGGGKGFMARMRDAAEAGSARPAGKETTSPAPKTKPSGPAGRTQTNGSKPTASQNGSKNGSAAKRPGQSRAPGSASSASGPKPQPRARDKRPRKGQ
jgi:YidC/Oxa1 family membrane protein insertase